MLNKAYYGSYYGGFRTRTFVDIFSDGNEDSYSIFKSEWQASPFAQVITKEEDLKAIFYLLYANYGNSHISYSDETQFKYALFSIMFMYGPTWAKRLEVQTGLRSLTENDLIKGGKAIHNHSYNPSTTPSTSTLEELTTINDQNTTNYVKSKMEGYATLMDLLDTDVTKEFIDKFKKLFIKIVASDYPLLYETILSDEEY